MKKRIILLGLVIAFALPTFAQSGTSRHAKNEISIGYGFHPVSGDDFLPKINYYRELDHVGAISAAYTRMIDTVVGVGITYCYDPRIVDCYDLETHICSLDESCHSIMAHAKFNCFRYKFLLIYGKFDAGICFWDYRLQEYHPENYEVILPKGNCCFAWQYAFGVEANIGGFGLFAQQGLGMEGYVSFGIKYKF